MLRYVLSTLRARKQSFVGAFVALSAAAALVTACGMLLETGLRGTIETERYAGVPIVVSGDQNVHETQVTQKSGKPDKVKHKSKALFERVWLPSSTVDVVNAVEGVAAAVPEVNFPAHVVDRGGPVLDGPGGKPSWGHAWESARLTPLSVVDGRHPARDDEIVIDAGLAERAGLEVGDTTLIQATDAPSEYEVVGVAAAAAGDLTEQSAVFFSQDEAQRLAGRAGEVAVVGVLPEPGVDVQRLQDDIERALSDTTAQVHSGDQRGAVEFLAASVARLRLVSMGGAMAGTSMLVAILVVVGTFALSIQQRHRELAMLRAIAATRGQVRRLIGREAVVIGMTGGLLGAGAGLLLGRWLYSMFTGFGTIPDTLDLTVSPLPVAGAVFLATSGAWISARISARQAARIRPVEAMAEAAIPERLIRPGRLFAGLAFLGAGIVLVFVLSILRVEQAASPVTFVTVVVLSTGVALLGPVIARLATTLLALPMRMFRVGGHLASANAAVNAVRLGSVVAPLSLMIAMASTVIFVQTTLTDASQREAQAGNLGDLVLVADGPGVAAPAAEELRGVAGVDAVTEVQYTTVRVGLENYQVYGASSSGLAATTDLGVRAGSMDEFGDGDIAVSELSADRLDLAVGDDLELTMGDGTELTQEVVAVYDRGLGFGDLTMDHDVVAAHVDNPLARSVVIEFGDDVDREALAAVAESYPGHRLIDADTADQLRAESRQANVEINYLALGLVVAFTALAVVNTLAMSTTERIREFAVLQLVGATRRQVMRMLRVETIMVALTAAVIGTGVAFGTLTAFAAGMTGRAAPHVPPPVYVAILAGALLLALVATAVPGRFAMRSRPEEAIGVRE